MGVRVVDEAIRELSADAIISAGGWHPRYARVLLIERDDDAAMMLVDGNGDGAELELEYWHRDVDGAWHGGSCGGHGPLAGWRRNRVSGCCPVGLLTCAGPSVTAASSC